MIAKLENKYKDNTPINTINNIIEFFQNKGYSTVVSLLQQPTPGIWWCVIKLKYKDITIASANGKGVTKDFALASGYSELYERYCNFSTFSKINQNKLFELNYSKNNYYLFPDEKILSLKDINKVPIMKQFCELLDDESHSFTKFITRYPLNLLSLPFSGFNKNDQIDIPFFLLNYMTGSSGMAAGNSIEEALTQGLSELCEHYVHQQIYYEKRSFYSLDPNTINLPDHIKKFLENLLNLNYKYYIYDFSYLYQLPVVGLLIIDTTNHVSYFDIAAAPVFSIALERCCTEIYQGYSFLGDSFKTHMILEKNPNIDKQALVKESYVSFPFNNYYPDNLILNSIQISQFNKNIFLANNDYSNMELNLYYKNIFNHKNWEVYYRDLSQDNNIKAIKCYINNVDILNVINDYKTLSNDLKSVQWEILLDWELLFEEYLNTKKINNELLDTILKKKQLMLTNSSFNSILKAFFTDFFNIPNNNIDFEEFNFDRFLQDFINQNWSSMIHEQYNDLKTLKFYLPLIQSNNYTKDEILKISEFYGIKYSDNDLQNYNNINYLIEQIYFASFYDNYYNQEYINLIQTFIPLIPSTGQC